MHIDSFFACSNSDLEDAEFVIFGIPYDATQSFKPGSRFAPTAIREASWNLETYSIYFDYELDFAKVCDAGNVNVDGGFDDVIENVSEFLNGLKKEQIPIALGGEHTVTYAIIKGLNPKDFVYVVFDAHFDLRNEFDGNEFNHACTTRRVFELGAEVVIIGVRSGTKEEVRFAKDNGIHYFHPWQNGILSELKRIIDDRAIYLSIDMDAFDPAFAPGVSTPEPFGLDPKLMLPFFKEFGGNVFAMDIVEVIPDTNWITQSLAAKLVFEFIASHSGAKESK